MTPNEAREFRAAQIALIEDKFSNLVDDDLGLTAVFVELCCQTHETLGVEHWCHRICFRPCASSAMNLASPVSEIDRRSLPMHLQEGWLEWSDSYTRLLARNPRLELAAMMEEISEWYDGSSWPYGNEDRLREWVDADDITTFPLEMRADFPNEGFYRRLQHLRRITAGWTFWSNTEGRTIFVADIQ